MKKLNELIPKIEEVNEKNKALKSLMESVIKKPDSENIIALQEFMLKNWAELTVSK
jgi:hypothetical protein